MVINIRLKDGTKIEENIDFVYHCPELGWISYTTVEEPTKPKSVKMEDISSFNIDGRF